MAQKQTDDNSNPAAESSFEPQKNASARRRFPKWFNWRTGIVVAVCALCYLSYREILGAKRLPLILAGFEEYAASVQTYEGLCEGASTSDSPADFVRVVQEFAVDMANHRVVVENRRQMQVANMPRLTLRFRELAAVDGASKYQLTYLERQPQDVSDDWEPHNLSIAAGGGLDPGPGPWDLIGMSPTGRGSIILRTLENGHRFGKVRYGGRERVNGAVCDLVTITIDDSPDYRTSFWFDPAHDYLPRRQVHHGGRRVDVFEFEQYRDESSGKMRWFPSRGRIQFGAGGWNFVVTELRINPPLDIKRFQVDAATLPDGVKIS